MSTGLTVIKKPGKGIGSHRLKKHRDKGKGIRTGQSSELHAIKADMAILKRSVLEHVGNSIAGVSVMNTFAKTVCERWDWIAELHDPDDQQYLADLKAVHQEGEVLQERIWAFRRKVAGKVAGM